MMLKHKYKAPAHYGIEEKEIWELLIYRDFVAFCSEDWNLIKDDFIVDGFYGIDGKKSNDKSKWSLAYPNLTAYKEDWKSQSRDFCKEEYTKDPLNTLFNSCELRSIEIKENIAFVHKVFDGAFTINNKAPLRLNWLSLFVLRKVAGNWKIAGFTGYLPK